jgi:general secretion pathway protein J
MKRQSARRTVEDGFTLVELLVAITLVCLLTVVLFGGLRFGTRAASAVSLRTDRSAQIAVVYDFMQSELADARMLPTSNDSAAASADFDGRTDSLSFVTIPPAYLALGGFHLLHVAMEGERQTRRLTVSWQQIPRGSLPVSPTTLQPSVILQDIRGVQFGYFGAADPNRPPEWQDRWDDRSALPLLVRLRIAWADGSRAPDLIVAPRLAGPPQLSP